MRLAASVLIGALGSVGMWSVVVALPTVQAEFGATRGTASLAFTLAMLGFGSGGVLTGKITDRYGIVTTIGLGIGCSASAIAAPEAASIWQFILVHFAIGLASSATFGPLMAEASHWFERTAALPSPSRPAATISAAPSGRRSSAGACRTTGWRTTHMAVGIFTAVA